MISLNNQQPMEEFELDGYIIRIYRSPQLGYPVTVVSKNGEIVSVSIK